MIIITDEEGFSSHVEARCADAGPRGVIVGAADWRISAPIVRARR